jgi:hypothetical protein
MLQARASPHRSEPSPVNGPHVDGATGADDVAKFTANLRRATTIAPIDAATLRRKQFPSATVGDSSPTHWVNRLPPAGAPHAVHDVALSANIQPRLTVTDSAADRRACWAVLDDLSRVRCSGTDAAGRPWQSRANPSAGGTHSLQPLLMLTEPGSPSTVTWWRSDGTARQQVQVANPAPLQAALAAASRDLFVGACVVAVAEPELLRIRYPNGESLLWRDAGAFLATCQYIAAGRGLGSRILGITVQLEPAAETVPAFVLGAVALSQPEGTRDT